MDAKKCDFCGAFFAVDLKTGNSVKIDSYFNTKRLDICPDCLRKVFAFVRDDEQRIKLLKTFLKGEGE